ncbi:uncharacterized protein LOC108905682 isoform X2 [Anoplophora glabripennis]|uniref:uncharacterized protein LOC108905682 isoform X2 n=1 Tax=Anoplophora glabripennis TaxID=217634 RepID=UPI00087430E8|nr:uncharacterized protein LOC108905682 isoform X2 [Anoplophora glabripennis]
MFSFKKTILFFLIFIRYCWGKKFDIDKSKSHPDNGDVYDNCLELTTGVYETIILECLKKESVHHCCPHVITQKYQNRFSARDKKHSHSLMPRAAALPRIIQAPRNGRPQPNI